MLSKMLVCGVNKTLLVFRYILNNISEPGDRLSLSFKCLINLTQFFCKVVQRLRLRYLKLNDLGRKTPAQIRAEQCGREVRAAHKTRDNRYLWTYASIKNVLIEEAYTGVLISHRSETQDGKVKRLEQTEWYRHETFFPVIVEPDVWKLVQQRLKEQARPANGNRSKHRYAGLLRCQECGNVFVPMIRHWNGKRRVEYVCKGYHRSGKSYCSSHRIHEENLDTMVWEYFTAVRDNRVKEREKLVKLQKMWALRKPVLDAHILLLQKKVHELEREIDEILMDRIMK